MNSAASGPQDWRAAIARLFGSTGRSTGVGSSAQRVKLEAQLSLRLPDSLFALLDCVVADPKRASRLGEFRWLPVDEIGAIWKLHAQLVDDAEEVDPDIAGEWDERVQRVTHHRRRVPVAEFNGDVWIYLDHAPTAQGVAGQVIQVDPEGLSWFWLAPSFDQLLIDLAHGRVLDPDAGTQN
jgi:cell wall assembly regulator SMI1